MKTMELFHVAFEDQPQQVATLSVDYEIEDALEFIFRATQNVDSSWVEAANREGSPIKPSPSVVTLQGCRSTSVGDYVRVTEERGHRDVLALRPGWLETDSSEGLQLVGQAAMAAAYREST